MEAGMIPLPLRLMYVGISEVTSVAAITNSTTSTRQIAQHGAHARAVLKMYEKTELEMITK